MHLRTLSITLASAMVLAACGSSNNSSNPAPTSSVPTSSAPASSSAPSSEAVSSAVSSVMSSEASSEAVNSSMSSVMSSVMMSSSVSSIMSSEMSSMSSSSAPAPVPREDGIDCEIHTAEKGKAIYDTDCAFCHQAFDENGIAVGGVAGADPYDANQTEFAYLGNTSTDLAAFITANMPIGGVCDEDCGRNIAVYIKSLSDNPICAAPMAEFEISLINGSAKQILSPGAVILNDEKLNLWTIGAPASKALEMLAEAGSPDMLLEAYPGKKNAKSDPAPAGKTSSVTLSMMEGKTTMLSVATMPIFTNDAVVGVQNVAIDSLAAGYSMMIPAYILDAGTEANTETQATVPGFGMDGAGYSEVRDELTGNDQVTLHPGVVSSAELSTSGLGEAYRFDSGSFMIKVTRTK